MAISNSRNVQSGRAEQSSGGDNPGREPVSAAVPLCENDANCFEWYISSVSTIRFLAILNFVCLLVASASFTLGRFLPQEWDRLRFQQLGLVISFFSPVALCTDLLALHGLKKWRRFCLLPWLVAYGLLLTATLFRITSSFYSLQVYWHTILASACALVFFGRWRQVGLLFKLMSVYSNLPPLLPTTMTRTTTTTTAAAAAVMAQQVIGEGTPHVDDAKNLMDLPRYEDLYQPLQHHMDRARAEISTLATRLEQGNCAEGELGEEERSALLEELRQLEPRLAAMDAPSPRA